MRSLLSQFLRKLLSTVRSGLFVWTGVLIALSLFIWFYGPRFQYVDYAPFGPVTNRVIAIGVLVVLWGINNFFMARRAAREKPKAKREMVEKPRDQVEEQILLLRQSFRNAMQTIREKWTGRERGGRSIYALPWYLVLGPATSGKTSLIIESDLKFPLSHLLNDGDVKTARSTGLPQYWVTSDSVLFDMPGSWLGRSLKDEGSEQQAPEEGADGSLNAPDGKRRLWSAFLDLLVEYRPRRPINGVVLCVDATELVRATDETRTNLAADIHGKLVEIAERLGTRFTVHVVMTKLDRLAGFKDFFAQFSRQEREQPLGFSFPIFDEVNADQWIESFDQQFEGFIKRVNDDIIDRLYIQRDTETRRNTYVFSRELASLGPIAGEFLKRALHSDKFSTPPLVRGIYFTSVKQQGVPFNALLARVARDYHMFAPILPAYSGHSTRFFAENVFSRVIFREAGLAGDNKAVERRKRLALNGTILASVLGLLIFGFLLKEAMQDNSARAANILATSRDFVKLPRDAKPEDAKDEAQFLPALNAIAAANQEFPGWKDKADARRYLTLYQGRRVGPKVEEAYEELLRQRFVPTLALQVKKEMDRLGQSKETATSDQRLDALRVYLLLGDLQRRRELDSSGETASLGRKAIVAWMQANWQQRFEGAAPVQGDLLRHLEYALDTDRIEVPIDRQAVAATQSALREVPRDVRLYRSLQALSERQVPGGIGFRREIGPSFDIVFKQKGDAGVRTQPDIVIPYFFTKRGFHEFFVPKNDSLSVIAVEDAWVIGEREHVKYSPEDLEAFRDKIRHRYATDYINAWSNGLNGLNIVDFRNLDDATRVLEEINGPANPFGRLLMLVKNQTEIYDAKPVDQNAEQPKTEIAFDKNREHGLRIARAFADLSRIVTAGDKEKPFFEELMGTLGGLETYVHTIQSEERLSSKPVALEKAQERAKLQGDDPIYIIRRTGANLPQPFSKFFTQLADNSWTVVLAAAKHDLQTVWQDNVYRTFNVTLAPRYPFNTNARDEVTLQEFQQFFGPKGDFDSFFDQHLKTFINEHTGEPVVIDGQSLAVSDEFLKQVNSVRRIRDIFFDTEGVPTLRYTVEPLSLSGKMSRAVLNIEGQLVPYSHGPTRPIGILWPNALSSKQDMSQVSVFGTGGVSGTAGLSFQGLWSSYRLFDKAQISDVKPESVDLSFNVGGGKVKYRVRMSATENPFATRPLSTIKLPEQL
ncbi:type VI secretion system membrane subunit TssM [Phyllobacterium leguminum]|uniref:Type VI secretion system protein ImpL n=1 Tax=Phyllobacterium leguminum TaxID=314237 RepID=A0A318SZQ9_9HYPH|nr:type VI secretion system membrane subunit TssM [Phyllobacterium leguminum]PYE85287.1 type VI secretion system protein ImpL [Phyllobacterium leguminum]